MATAINQEKNIKKNYVLIDYENTKVESIKKLHNPQFYVYLFLGPNDTKIPVELAMEMHSIASRSEFIILESSGKNALDFYITYYLGVLSANNPDAYFHIITKDTGFDSLIKHIRAHKVSISRSPDIDEMPCFKQTKKSESDQVIIDKIIDAAKQDLLNKS